MTNPVVQPQGTRFELQQVGVEFGSLRALIEVDLLIEPGESVALVGPSGAGKTTLLRLLSGSLRPEQGVFQINGRAFGSLAPTELRRQRSEIGVVHQDLRLVPNVRVLQNVIAGRLGQLSLLSSLRAMLFPPRSFVEQAYAILERVGIPEKLYHRTDSLSGGQQQRVAVARALFQEPRALLADEPVSSVDPARARDTVTLLTEVCRERGLTLCMSLHDLELARQFFPRLVGLRRGQVVFDRAAKDLGAKEFQALYDLKSEAEQPSVG
jgi:phosphonate transport system ATP-binding protein